MIDIIKQTPQEYSSQSRDYQIIARLYSALFNMSKMYIDNLNVWNSDIDNSLATLRAKTLNFSQKRAWDLDDLEAVTSCFKYLMRIKGTLAALKACINILMTIEKIPGEVTDKNFSYDEKRKILTIMTERSLLTWGVMEDLIEYLLPAGVTYRLVEDSTINRGKATTELFVTDTVSWSSEGLSSDMLIGNDLGSHSKTTPKGDRIDWSAEGRVNYITDTYVYDNKEGKLIPEFEQESEPTKKPNRKKRK